MLKIACPWCGARSEAEFRSGGEGHIVRPAEPETVSDAEWADYLFYRNNPKGLEHERWVHRFGCGRWFNVARDTVTHEIKATYKMTDPKPSSSGGRS